MKAQITYLIIFFIIFNSCSTFKGTYCTPPNFTGSCIEFKNSREILYHTGNDYGELGMNYGIYRIIEDTLVIKFKKVPKKYQIKSDESYKITHFEPSNNDSTYFYIKCNGTDYANVHTEYIKHDMKVVGNSTNFDTVAIFQISKDILPTTIIAEIRKSKVRIPITQNGKYKIDVTLNDLISKLTYNVMNGDTSKYAIKTVNDSTYFTKIENSSIPTIYYQVKKKKKILKK